MPVEHMEYKLVHLLQWMRVHDEIINFMKSLVKCCPKTKKKCQELSHYTKTKSIKSARCSRQNTLQD